MSEIKWTWFERFVARLFGGWYVFFTYHTDDRLAPVGHESQYRETGGGAKTPLLRGAGDWHQYLVIEPAVDGYLALDVRPWWWRVLRWPNRLLGDGPWFWVHTTPVRREERIRLGVGKEPMWVYLLTRSRYPHPTIFSWTEYRVERAVNGAEIWYRLERTDTETRWVRLEQPPQYDRHI